MAFALSSDNFKTAPASFSPKMSLSCKAYLDEADHRHVLPMFYLELVSGLRKGELVALLWSDLDIENQTISVSKQATRDENGNIVITRPKTETSVRLVSIPQRAVELLQQEHLKHPDNPYMFPSTRTGEMYYGVQILTLSTCYDSAHNGRLLVLAAKL